jgi:cardiolipin synthase A/B
MVTKKQYIHTEQIFFVGNDYFSQLIIDINKACKRIEMETYIFEFDPLGKKIVKALTKAAKRGVAVRLLLDGAGTPQLASGAIEELEDSGVDTRIFHPFPWRLWQWSRSYVRVPSLVRAIYLLLKINSRNHRKVCIIDRKIAYIGSFNISQRHLAREQNGGGWRDTGVRLEHGDLKDLARAFEVAWAHLPIKERIRHFFRHIRANPLIRLNNTRHRRRILYKNLLKQIKNCKRRVWITNAYFIPDNFLLRRLNEVACLGVDVRILLPQQSDVAFMPWASKAFYESLLKSGVRIFEYKPSILHAKTLIIDDWMIIGSSNLNHRSLMHDLEVDVNVRLPESKKLLENQFLLDLQQAKEIRKEDWQRTWYQYIVGKILLYLKYFI